MDGLSIEAAREALKGLAGQPGVTWGLPILLGLGLAAATGLRTFLPLLALALSERFGLFGLSLNESWGWLTSDVALITLAVASVVEFVADKIPVVDNALNAVGLVARPAAAAIAAGSVFVGVDPTVAAVAGVMVGAPTALAFGAAQGTARAASTAATAGTANPLLSLLDDVLAALAIAAALLAPVLVPVLIVIAGVIVIRVALRLRRARRRRLQSLEAEAAGA